MLRLLVNPTAGGGRARRLACRLVRRDGFEVVSTTGDADLEERARRSAADGHERLLVAGGDGSLRRAAQALAGTGCALGVVPCGSGNDLARALGLSLDPDTALRSAASASARPIDVGRAGDEVFLCSVGIGFVSEVAGRAARRGRWLRGPWIYPWAVLSALASFAPPRLHIEGDDGTGFGGSAMFAVVANTPNFGGGMRIAPAARMDDGLLDLVVLERVSRLRLLAALPSVYRGTHTAHPALRMARTRRLRLAAERPAELYADGERAGLCGPAGVEVRVDPGALRVAY